MASYTITHSCGHEETLWLTGPRSQREWRIKKAEEEMCDACFREWKTAQCAKQNKELGLPELKGTEKQIAWAERIRHSAVEELERMGGQFEDEQDWFREGLELIYKQDSAAWWIDHRGQFDYYVSVRGLIARVLEEAVKKEQDSTPEAIAAKAEATIRPAEAKSEIVAEIAIDGGTISVHYPEKDDDLRAIVKGLKYRWINRAWRRTFTAKQGPVVDRAAEVAHHLLAAGFVVQILNPEAREKAVSGEYTPEQTRWISARDDRFIFTWGKDEDYYQVARRIPGSRYESSHVTVPSVQFEQVLDFADRYNFSLDASAQRLAEKAKAEKEAALIVEVEAPRKEKGLAPSTKPPELEVPEEVSVDESLLDDD
jgi:hypothetical protein